MTFTESFGLGSRLTAKFLAHSAANPGFAAFKTTVCLDGSIQCSVYSIQYCISTVYCILYIQCIQYTVYSLLYTV